MSREIPFHRNHGNSVLTNRMRYIAKVYDNKTGHEFVELNGRVALKSCDKNSHQVEAIVYTHKDSAKGISLMEFTIQKFYESKPGSLLPVQKSSFSFTQNQFIDLLTLLNQVKFIDFSNKDKFKVDFGTNDNSPIVLNLNRPDPEKILVDKDWAEVIQALNDAKDDDRIAILNALKSKVLSQEDLDILTGRKDGLEQFKESLKSGEFDEPQWQRFFRDNSWIFGYGLDYRFLGILQKEASVSGVDVDGKNEVKLDFLLASSNFTVIVELKRPDTKLFTHSQNRSESWELSNDLTHAISQILAQKAEWEIKSRGNMHDSEGNLIHQETINPKAFLIIGHSEQFMGDSKPQMIKRKTFELYRRNMRNIEIITYDELLERAEFIVTNKKS